MEFTSDEINILAEALREYCKKRELMLNSLVGGMPVVRDVVENSHKYHEIKIEKAKELSARIAKENYTTLYDGKI